MNNRVRSSLIRLARNLRGTVSCLTLVNENELGLHLDSSHERARLLEVLAEISTREHEAGRPLLNSLVRIKGSQGQGDAFFRVADKLGFGDWKELKQGGEFLDEQQALCREFWRDDANFEKFR